MEHTPRDPARFIRTAEERGFATQKEGDRIVHYTCNAPSEEVLRHFGIEAIGAHYGRAPREVLAIPEALFERFGFVHRDSTTTETLLRTIERECRRFSSSDE